VRANGRIATYAQPTDNRRVVSATVNFANLIELLVLPDWVAQHVACSVSGYEFAAQFIQWGAIAISNCYDVALGPAHARYLFMQNNGFAIAD
jgi:hypothetical protein